ncbi:endonuclease 8-like 1 [Amphibalanus amphitrite]|uniref:endonuclease 8-like 1 n=1 Tax=Amphibalanus amphitrite TaxID=1232801 RepID=UPI001C91E66D|nr:endonuclease 8-like 1 [Amphibalanus amphitrite]
MPEGPELHLSSRFVKKVGDARQFAGKILERLPANRAPRLDDLNSRLGAAARYTITSWSRGKELMLAIKPLDLPETSKYRPEEWSIRFNFGMTGCFKFTRTDELPKHAKVCFTAVGEPACTLSFVDMRGFGRWTPTSDWSDNRGPCILQERDLFRAHVLASLEASPFSKPICEVMLDQRYFNGVGNYLRAEALHRLGVAPFARARDLLASLPERLEPGRSDLLHMCHQLAAEVVALGGGRRYDVPLDVLHELLPRDGVKEEGVEQNGLKKEVKRESAVQNGLNKEVKEEGDEGKEEVDAFEEWLQCYYQPGMKNLVDHQGRTVWFAGSPGPMVPKARKQRHESSKKADKQSVKSESSDEGSSPPEKRAKRAPRRGTKAEPVEDQAVTDRRVSSRGTAGKESAERTVKVKNEISRKTSTASNKAAGRKGAGKSTKSRSAVVAVLQKTERPSPGQRRSKRISAAARQT